MQCAGGDCQPWSDDSLQRVRYNFDMREEKVLASEHSLTSPTKGFGHCTCNPQDQNLD